MIVKKLKRSVNLKILRVYEKMNDPANAAIAYEKYTQDQKLLNNLNGSVSNNF